MNLKTTLGLLTGRSSHFILSRLGRGSTLPGKLALQLDKDILQHLAKNYEIVVVTGTNGKTLTTALTVGILKEIPVAAMPRGHVNGDLRGAFKAVVNTETKEILVATIFSEGSQEIINIITVAMDNNIPYTYFTKQIFTHPTLAENLNDLFAI